MGESMVAFHADPAVLILRWRSPLCTLSLSFSELRRRACSDSGRPQALIQGDHRGCSLCAGRRILWLAICDARENSSCLQDPLDLPVVCVLLCELLSLVGPGPLRVSSTNSGVLRSKGARRGRKGEPEK